MKNITKTTLLSGLLVLSSCSQNPHHGGNHAGHHAHSYGAKVKYGKVNSAPNTLISNERQLTHVGRRSGEGYFDHDGQNMVFQSERHKGNPFYQIYVMNMESGKSTRISNGSGKTTCAWIHPNGKRVMYSSTHLDPKFKNKVRSEYKTRHSGQQRRYSWSYDENFDIFETGINGRRTRRLTKALGYDAEGSYSPNGKLIAFASNRSGYDKNISAEDKKIFEKDQSYMMDIYIMNADGSNVKQLTTSRGYDGGPFFSADGKKITWRRFTPDGHKAEIFTMNIDGSDQKKVTQLNAMSWAPYYHPSGDYVIFNTNIHGYKNFELYMVDAKGTKDPVRVTFADGFDGLPVFHPNGRMISWTKKNSKGISQIYTANWDDLQARKLLGLEQKAPKASDLTPAIHKKDMEKVVHYLASEKLKGRAAGSMEEKIYTKEFAKLFKELGLKPIGPKYLQKFKFTSGVNLGSHNKFMIGEDSLKLEKEWIPLSFSKKGKFENKDVVFAGYGIVAPASDKVKAYDSYGDLDVKDKWVMVFRYIPEGISEDIAHNLRLYSRLQHKAMVARNKGALGLIVVSGPNSKVKKELDELKYEGVMAGAGLAVVSVKDSVAKSILKASDKDLEDLQDELDKGKIVEGFTIPNTKINAQIDINHIKSEGINVLGKIDVGAKETIIVGAHGDHLGLGHSGNSLARADEKTNIHFGADDNASGVAGLIELAHSLQSKKSKLKRNIIFAIWSAEEVGLLGSNHFLKSVKKRYGKRKMKKSLVAYFNMDMIGRMKDKLLVQAVGSSKLWPSMVESLSIKHKLKVSTQKDPYLPTDSMAFYMSGIPGITLFTGAHMDYHSPRDTADLIDYDSMYKIVSFADDFVYQLARSTKKIAYNKIKGNRKHSGKSRKFRVYLGTIPDYSQEGVVGVRVSGSAKGGPAEKAGIIPGDIIVELAGKRLENLYDYVYALQALRPGKTVAMKVKRKGEVKVLSITPASKH